LPISHPLPLLLRARFARMECFQTKTPNFGKIWMALEWKKLLYSMAFWNILRPFGTYMLWPFGNLLVISCIFHRFGILKKGKIWQPCLRRWICFSFFANRAKKAKIPKKMKLAIY
jgi:hypothetical protein